MLNFFFGSYLIFLTAIIIRFWDVLTFQSIFPSKGNQNPSAIKFRVPVEILGGVRVVHFSVI